MNWKEKEGLATGTYPSCRKIESFGNVQVSYRGFLTAPILK